MRSRVASDDEAAPRIPPVGIPRACTASAPSPLILRPLRSPLLRPPRVYSSEHRCNRFTPNFYSLANFLRISPYASSRFSSGLFPPFFAPHCETDCSISPGYSDLSSYSLRSLLDCTPYDFLRCSLDTPASSSPLYMALGSCVQLVPS